MARVERGTYEPSDEVRVFDGAEEEDDAEGSRLPLLIVLALLVLCAFAGVVWLAYTQGVARGRTETPVLAAAPGPEKVAPQNAGGANVQYQGFKIYEQPAPPDEQADAAPPQQAKAEAPPVAKPEASEAAPPKPEPKLAAATPPPVAKAEPKPEPAPKVAPPPVAKAEPKPLPAPKVVAAPPVAKPVPDPKVAAAPPPVAKPEPKPAPAKPLPPPPVLKQATTAPAPSTVATGAPRTLPGVAATETPAPKPVAAAAPAAKGNYVLQIGSYKSPEDAAAAWKAYKAKHAALLTGFGSDVQKVDLGEKGIWYRQRITGFADKDGAQATCERLGGGCIVGK